MTDKLKVLTVGDGDLTLSLALVRAYGDFIDLTASVLDSKDDLLRAYPDAPVNDLGQFFKVPIHFGVDATQLHKQSEIHKIQWDLILFHHPHLGLASLEQDEAKHADRHFRLLCHYLYSAQQVSKLVHVCLCGTQSETWKLRQAANRTELKLLKTLSTAVPFSKIWTNDDLPAAQSLPQFAAPRRYRNGKLGSRHFLGKYGYRHRRTEGDRYNGNLSDMNVSGSEHFVFCKRETSEKVLDSSMTSPSTASLASSKMECFICSASFSSQEDLEMHMTAPAKPEEHSTKYMPIKEQDPVKEKKKVSSKENVKSETLIQEKPEKSNASHKESLASFKPNDDDDNQIHLDPQKEEKREGLVQIAVTEQLVGKRLRWIIQHNVKEMSKRQAESSIQAGMVFIDGTIVKDSSRILNLGNIILVRRDAKETQTKKVTLEVVYRIDSSSSSSLSSLVVVWKPGGMRTKGMFPGTLEALLSEQEGQNFSSLSSLEVSCPGLCVLISGDTNVDSPHIVTHVMTALVHGQIPAEWSRPTDVSVEIKSKWNKRNHDGESVGDTTMENVQICLIESMDDTATTSTSAPSSLLSTISIRTKTPSTSSLCQFLRQAKCPVVGDTYCRQEYLNLKRSIRNRIKNKLCIGCYAVELNGVTVATLSPPEKLSARYWAKHLQKEHGKDDNDS